MGLNGKVQAAAIRPVPLTGTPAGVPLPDGSCVLASPMASGNTVATDVIRFLRV